MLVALKSLAALSMVWAAVALAWQVVTAWGGGRHEYSRQAGTAWRGVAYNFTTAMLPSHKESARLHPLEFVVGIVLHVGALFCLLHLVLRVSWPLAADRLLPGLVPAAGPAVLAGLYLLVRRARSPVLRAMSSADDFIAIGAVLGLLILAGLHGLGLAAAPLFLAYGVLLFVYLPLGKLRHVVFFFVARADYGRRLGHRGVFPVSPPVLERPHVRTG